MDILEGSGVSTTSLELEDSTPEGVPCSSIVNFDVVDFQICEEIETSLIKTAFSVFPNPSKDLINVDLRTLDKPRSLIIRDLLGRSILSLNNIADHTIQVDLSNLKPGNYLIEVYHEGGSSVQKLILN